jgi:FkbM family methyltransferase
LVRDRPVWIFGAGHFGQDVCAVLRKEGIDVRGFIESRPRTAKVLGLPVLTWSELRSADLSAQLALGIFNRETPLDELMGLAASAGFKDVFMPWDIYAQFGGLLGWRFWLSAPAFILDNLPSIRRTYHSLADEESRRCFLQICAFRLGENTAYASFRHADQQYFNSLTLGALTDKKVTYIDGGAYNGDTFIELVSQVDVATAYLFEPDPENFRALVATVTPTGRQAVCLPLALTDGYRILSFSAGNGEGGAISESGAVHIAAVALDEMLPTSHVDFIKLDVEGAEIQALTGALGMIGRSRPIMAISLYHRPQDLWEIPEWLSHVCHDYRFYLRQHYCNSFDSVLYAIPISAKESQARKT